MADRIRLVDYIDNHPERADVGTPFYRWLVAAFSAHSDAYLVVESHAIGLFHEEGIICYGVFYPDKDDGWIDDESGDWISDMEDE